MASKNIFFLGKKKMVKRERGREERRGRGEGGEGKEEREGEGNHRKSFL